MSGCGLLSPPPPRPDPPTLEELEARCFPEDGYDFDYQACTRAGPMLIKAGKVERGIQALSWACHRIPSACTDLGLRYLQGDGVEKDMEKAFSTFERGCLSLDKDPDACGWSGFDSLMRSPVSPIGRLNIEHGLDFTCRYGATDWGCFNYGVALACGLLGEPDPGHAQGAFARSCTLGDERGCRMLDAALPGAAQPPCSLIGPDPEHPIPIELDLTPLPPDAALPEGVEPFERTPLPVR
jgi:hypothetical protein